MIDTFWRNRSNESKQLAYRKKREHRAKLKASALKVFGSSCKCGFNDERALQLDHIHGGGTRERNGKYKCDKVYQYYVWIIQNPDLARLKFQLLCANCNWIKRYEANELKGRRSCVIKSEQLADPQDSAGGHPDGCTGSLPLNSFTEHKCIP